MFPDTFIRILETLAPPEGAAEWDNTGLMLEAGPEKPIRHVMLTLDLTPAVAAEALSEHVDWIVSYHPPIFTGLTRLSREQALTAGLIDLLQAGISVYSPHTALDAAEEGVSDWLSSAFPDKKIEPVEGSGRMLTLNKALTFSETTARVQTHLNAPYLRVCKPMRAHKIKRIGLCPGAGASVLKEMASLDAVLTGEMRHHDMLSWQASGVYVILSEHGHTERPYLKVFRQRLLNSLPEGIQVSISRKDKEPVSLLSPDA